MIDVKQLLTTDKLWDYKGGVFPKYNKEQSRQLPIQPYWIPPVVRIPVRQHIGQSGHINVTEGERVLKGQLLTEPTHGMAVPVHAPTSGIIESISQGAANHPSGLSELTLTIRSDGNDEWRPRQPYANADELSNDDLLQLIRYAGISGMGGAGFPTEIKLTPVADIKLLLMNGAECEPYISADDTLMQAHANEVVQGILLMARLLDHPVVVIAIEDDKPEAIEAMTQATADYDQIRVRSIPAKYPSGGERQLIQIITGEEVPHSGIPADLGIVVQNVGTAHAVARAVYHDEPLISRVVTLTGQRVLKPANHWVLLGTPIEDLLHHHGLDELSQVIVGGPMMGYQLPKLSGPVIKTTNCLIVPGQNELSSPDNQVPCIRCGSCADACPVNLLPQQLHWYALAEDHEKLSEHNLNDCIECGACAYVCPSEIPLVLEYRQAKAAIRASKQEQLKSERAKQRFESRNLRLEQEKIARAEKHQQAAQARLKAMAEREQQASAPAATDDKKSAVAAALARAKAKKAGAVSAPPKTVVDESGQTIPDNRDVAAQREARKAEARARKAQKAAQAVQDSGATPTELPADSAQQSADVPAADNKAARVAAAVARAKAKRQAQQTQADDSVEQPAANLTEQVTGKPAADDKAARVAAAVAHAKAKRQAQQTQAGDSVEQPVANLTEQVTDKPAADDKAARVAAAVARAKAKRQAQQAENQRSPDATPRSKDQSDS
ncbi:electron transport complex subunit RsxC [Neiella marina]|uniref:Ion-translocating oxidoreductase complex subunit C n=1 Tax=Neiella holothuriorum TaxID=2870530 RepID=A0ABS7EEC7_9GAMM|nr:electron transport complex subunit RsxC [Neiella holothuriorum]MBW8190699.1 electron transport complex subunit RsxC [Neiella holothuriorum]